MGGTSKPVQYPGKSTGGRGRGEGTPRIRIKGGWTVVYYMRVPLGGGCHSGVAIVASPEGRANSSFRGCDWDIRRRDEQKKGVGIDYW